MPAKCPPPSSTSRQAKPSLRRGSLVGLEPHGRARRVQPEHRAGVGAMRRHLAAVFQHDVGEESFIPAHEGAADQGAGEAHRRRLDRRRDEDKPPMPNPTAAMLTIGDEILSGRTRDTNMPHLAQALAARGIAPARDPGGARRHGRDRRGAERAPRPLHPRLHLRRHRPDPRRHHRRRGGRRLRRRRSTCARTPAPSSRSNYANPEVELNPARLRMARIPDGAALIENPVSRAPGFSLGNVHVMAGVPAVFEAMVAGLLPRLTGGRPLLSRDACASTAPRARSPARSAASPRRHPAVTHRQLSVHPRRPLRLQPRGPQRGSRRRSPPPSPRCRRLAGDLATG